MSGLMACRFAETSIASAGPLFAAEAGVDDVARETAVTALTADAGVSESGNPPPEHPESARYAAVKAPAATRSETKATPLSRYESRCLYLSPRRRGRERVPRHIRASHSSIRLVARDTYHKQAWTARPDAEERYTCRFENVYHSAGTCLVSLTAK